MSGGGLQEPSPVPFCTGQLEQTSDKCYGGSVESSCFSSPGTLILPFPLHRRAMGKLGSTFMPSLLLHRRRWKGPVAEVGLFFTYASACLLLHLVLSKKCGCHRWIIFCLSLYVLVTSLLLQLTKVRSVQVNCDKKFWKSSHINLS